MSRIARKHVKVVLTGDGGDESFLGYERYLALRRLAWAERLPRPMARAVGTALAALPDAVDRVRLMRRVRRAGRGLGAGRSQRYAPFVAYFDDAEKRQLYGRDLQSLLQRSALDRLEPWLDAVESLPLAAAWADAHTYLPDDLLVKVDIASLAHGLETRAPFLDPTLMTWAAGLAELQRFPGAEPKGLLKRAMEPYLPRELLYRPKMGFAVPIDRWVVEELGERVADVLLGGRLGARGLFKQDALEQLLQRHRSGERQGYRIWALVMLELWFRQWIDAADPFAEPVAARILGRHQGMQASAGG